MRQPQSITFFIDRCLCCRDIVSALKGAGLTIEVHHDHFADDAQDVIWLPEIGKREWVILTKDSRIGNNLLERLAVASAQVKLFTLASQNLRGQEMAEIFLKAIISIQTFVRKNPAPFIAKISKDGKISRWKDHEMLIKELEQYL
jgi:predicted nuclease of predicted toxin-antitoxin system